MYAAMLATPLRVVEVLVGHLGVVAFHLAHRRRRSSSSSARCSGRSPRGGCCSPCRSACCTGLAFAVPMFALLRAHIDNDNGFGLLFRFVMTPLMLFSGTFFPVDQLPGVHPAGRRGSRRSGTASSCAARRPLGTAPGPLARRAPGRARSPTSAVGLGARPAHVHQEAGLVSALAAAARRVARRCRSPRGSAWRGPSSGATSPRSAGPGCCCSAASPSRSSTCSPSASASARSSATSRPTAGTTVPYAAFVAPALLAASAMNGADRRQHLQRLLQAEVRTPLRRDARHPARARATSPSARSPGRSCAGRCTRRCSSSSRCVAGLVQSWWALLALPAAVLIGLAFGAVGMFATTFMTTLAALRLRHPRDPADVPVLRDLLPAVDLPRVAPVAGARPRRSTRGSRSSAG